MTYRPDEYDVERSHELERRLDRDFEREPHRSRSRRAQERPRCFSRLMFLPIRSTDVAPSIDKQAA